MGVLTWCGRAIRRRLGLIAHDRRGASAVEFAFLAPLLISIYITSFEITEGYTASDKVLKAAGTIADIVTRQPTVDRAFLGQMIDTAEAILAPHSVTGMSLRVTGITIDSAGNPEVLWSWDQDNNIPYAIGTTAPVPDDMRLPSSFLVRAELAVPHTLLLFLGSGADFTGETRTLTLSREFYYRQRLGNDIPCSDC